MRINDIKLYVATLAVTVAALCACKDESDSWEIPYNYEVSVVNATIGFDESYNIIKTKGNPQSTLTATIDANAAEWCSFDAQQQQLTLTIKPEVDFKVYTRTNNSDNERVATIHVVFANGKQFDTSFTQLAYTEGAEYNRDWGEQPVKNDSNPNYIHKTYYVNVSDDVKIRNYSICFDIEKRVSHWVAYPIHQYYTGGNVNRSNAWAFDDAVSEKTSNGYRITSTYVSALDAYDSYTYPIIEQKYQQNVVSGAYSDRDENRVLNLNRGHMLPSASRQMNWDANAQTFYATNMMPQNGPFNQQSWANLEDNVRKSRCSDTLYVVVGTLYEEGAKRITARQRDITVPSHCYKLLLRTKAGNTGLPISKITDPNDLICIGFLYENQDAAKSKTPSQAAVSVAEIERRSGFTFFRNINDNIAEEVKNQCNLSDWSAIN